MEQYDLDKAHKYSSNHKPELEKDKNVDASFVYKYIILKKQKSG